MSNDIPTKQPIKLTLLFKYVFSFFGRYALGVIRYFVWLDISFVCRGQN